MRNFEKVKRLQDTEVTLPTASTKHSAGYDFFAPEDVIIPPSIISVDGKVALSKPCMIKTGIKACMEEDEVLLLYNRSSNPGKLGLMMANSVGVIDADYYNNEDNDGEIAFAFYNMGFESVKIEKGMKIGQGVFSKFLKTDDDSRLDATRTGGVGSTGK